MLKSAPAEFRWLNQRIWIPMKSADLMTIRWFPLVKQNPKSQRAEAKQGTTRFFSMQACTDDFSLIKVMGLYFFEQVKYKRASTLHFKRSCTWLSSPRQKKQWRSKSSTRELPHCIWSALVLDFLRHAQKSNDGASQVQESFHTAF